MLVSYGRNVEALIEPILSTSEHPLHYSEIAHRIAEAYGKSFKVRNGNVQNALVKSALLYGRGIFGLLKHCPLSADELELVRKESQEIIALGSRGRQWTCAELVDILTEHGLDFDGQLNHYILNIALRDSPELTNLGRFVWTQSTEAPLGSAHRINMQQAVISLLMQAGKPMSNSEIKEALRKDRGIGQHFQINPSGSLIQVGEGRWGLIERDLALNAAEQAQLIDVLEKMLRDRNAGIHISEIAYCLEGIFEPASRIKDPGVLFAIAQQSNIMRKSVGGYLFLSKWGEPRRLNQSQAILEALKQSGEHGLTANEIVKSASTLLGREIPRRNIYGDISAAGARFDEEKKRWAIASATDDLDDA